MKNRFSKITILAAVVCMGFAFTNRASAGDVNEKEGRQAYKVADLLVVRPLGLVMTIAGSAVYVATLPITTISKDAKDAQHVLVEQPAQIAFGKR
jgi:hypothetical protein